MASAAPRYIHWVNTGSIPVKVSSPEGYGKNSGRVPEGYIISATGAHNGTADNKFIHYAGDTTVRFIKRITAVWPSQAPPRFKSPPANTVRGYWELTPNGGRLGKSYRVRPESCRSTASSNLAPPSNGVP